MTERRPIAAAVACVGATAPALAARPRSAGSVIRRRTRSLRATADAPTAEAHEADAVRKRTHEASDESESDARAVTTRARRTKADAPKTTAHEALASTNEGPPPLTTFAEHEAPKSAEHEAPAVRRRATADESERATGADALAARMRRTVAAPVVDTGADADERRTRTVAALPAVTIALDGAAVRRRTTADEEPNSTAALAAAVTKVPPASQKSAAAHADTLGGRAEVGIGDWGLGIDPLVAPSNP